MVRKRMEMYPADQHARTPSKTKTREGFGEPLGRSSYGGLRRLCFEEATGVVNYHGGGLNYHSGVSNYHGGNRSTPPISRPTPPAGAPRPAPNRLLPPWCL